MTEDRDRVPSRVLAFGGLWLLLAGLLSALSFVELVLLASAALLVVGLAVVAISRLRSLRIGRALRTSLRLAERAARALERRRSDLAVRRRVARLRTRVRETAAGAPDRVAVVLARALQAYAIAVYWLSMRASQAFRRSRLPGAARRQALRRNELGAQLRRQGEHEQAAEQHRVALAIVRELGDEEAEALTLNNLALALAQGGAEVEAVEHLERALVVFRRLGDEEHEGQVIANLGLVHRRQGHSEEAVHFLHEALAKLPPESSAYRRVEEELLRAS